MPGWAVYKTCVMNTNAANDTCTQSIHLWEYSLTRHEEKGEGIVSDACTVKNTPGVRLFPRVVIYSIYILYIIYLHVCKYIYGGKPCII